MASHQQRSERLIALFVAGILMFGYPIVGLFSGGELFGVPRLFVYLFLAWLTLIALVALNLREPRGRRPPRGRKGLRP